MPLKDIRPDLTQRLEAVRTERRTVAERLRDLDGEESTLVKALDYENRRFNQPQNTITAVPEPRTLPMPGTAFPGSPRDFALFALQDGQKLHLDDIKAFAEQHRLHVPDGSSLGRMLHGALLGLRNEGKARSLGNGYWQAESETAPMSLIEAVTQ